MSDSTQRPVPEDRGAVDQPTSQPGWGQSGPGPDLSPSPDLAPPPAALPPPAPMPAPGVPTSGVGQPADLLMRFLARLIDNVVLFLVNLIVVTVVVVGAIFGASASPFGGSGGGFLVGAVGAVLSAAINLGYFTVMENKTGQTVGKMALGLRTQGPNGANPTVEEALKRNAWTGLGVLAIIPVVGGLIGSLAQLAAAIYIAITINNNTVTRQGWHDEFAGGTRVIRVR